MPRVTLATEEQARDLMYKIRRFAEGGFVDRNNFRQQELDALRAFPDKALKAFYARKILRLPGGIGAEVFGITTGLISQAEATGPTLSRSGRERLPNAYSAANASNSSSNELGVFNLPGGGVVATVVNNDVRRETFKNFARLAIVANRGADVVSFQPRLVSGYMNESDALFFKNTTLPLWRDEVALVMGGQNPPGSVGAAQPEATASNSLDYDVTSAGVMSMSNQNAEIATLIAAGTDREQATNLVEGLVNRMFNFTIPGRQGSTVDYRLHYFGSILNKPDSESIKSFIAQQMRLDVGQVTMGVRAGDLVGRFTLVRAEQTAPSQPESTDSTTLTSVRNPDGLNPVEMSGLRSLLESMNYPNTFLPALNQATPSENRIIGFNVEGGYNDSVPQRLRIYFKFDLNQTDASSRRLFNRINRAAENNGLGGGDFWSDFETGIGNVSYVLSMLSESASTATTTPSAASTQTAQPESATTPTVSQEWRMANSRIQAAIAEPLFIRLRMSGYSRRDVQDLAMFLARYRLRVRSIRERDAVRRMPQNLRLDVVGENSSARTFRNGTFLNFLRGTLRSIGNTDAEVQVLSPGGGIYQSATFRGTRRGQTPVGALVLPMGNESTTEQQGTTEQPASGFGVINASQRVRLGAAGWTDEEITRFANRIFVMDGRVAQVNVEPNTLIVEGTFTNRSEFYTSAMNLRDSALVSIHNRLPSQDADAMINEPEMRWSVTMRNIDQLRTSTERLSQPMTPTRGRNRQIVYLGNVIGPENRIYRSGDLMFTPNGTFSSGGGSRYSAMAFFYEPSQGSILSAPLGTIETNAGGSFANVMNYLTDNARLSSPGKLKAYYVGQNAIKVAKGIVGLQSVTFTPTRPAGNSAGTIEMEVDRIRVYIPSDFAQWASTEPMLSIFRGIAGGTASSGQQTSTGTAQQTSPITLLSPSQLKSLATSPYSFGFGLELEGFIRQGTRKKLSEKMRADGIKVYTTRGYRSKVPVSGEEPYRSGHIWRQESDSSVHGYDARDSGGSDPTGEGQTFELVSKILNSSADNKSGNNDWIPYIEKFCGSLAKNGVLIDPSSGIHIHVGYPNFNAEQTKNLFINSVLMIPVLKGLVSEAWKSRSYARFPNTADLARKLSTIANTSGSQGSVVGAYTAEFGRARYSYLNTSNFGLSEKPTFEYRFQGSSIEKDTMVNTIRILQQIWKASLKGVIPIKQGSGKEQDKILVDLLGLELFSFARNRYAETELPLESVRSSNRFPGFKFPINASSIT